MGRSGIFSRYLEIDHSRNRELGPILTDRFFYEGRLFHDSRHLYYLNAVFGTLFKLDRSGRGVASIELGPFLGPKAEAEIERNRASLREGIRVERQPEGVLMIPVPVVCRGASRFGNRLYILDRSGSEAPTRVDGKEIREVTLLGIDLEAMKPAERFRFRTVNAGAVHDFVAGRDRKGLCFIVAQELEEGPGFVRYSAD